MLRCHAPVYVEIRHVGIRTPQRPGRGDRGETTTGWTTLIWSQNITDFHPPERVPVTNMCSKTTLLQDKANTQTGGHWGHLWYEDAIVMQTFCHVLQFLPSKIHKHCSQGAKTCSVDGDLAFQGFPAAKSHKTALIAILCYTPKICLHAILFKSFRVSFQANNSKEHNLVSEGWHCHFQTKYVLQVLLPQDVRETLCIFQHKANVALRATATVVAFMKLRLFTMFAHYGIAKNECSVDPEDLSICECHRHFSKMLHPQNPIRSN